MPCAYELLVIDLDGTLLNSAGEVTEGNRQAIRRAREAGIEVIVATGRALVESLDPLEAIGRAGLVIAAGGAMLNDADTGRTIHSCVMPRDLVADVTNALLPHGHKVLLLKDPDVTGYHYLAVGPAELDPASQWWFETLPVSVRFAHEVGEDPHPDQTVRVAAVAGEAELAPIARHLKAELGDRCFLQHWAAVTETQATGSATHVLEVFNPDVNKWTMIARLCEERGIGPRRVAAIGDGLNDVQMVRAAGLGIAMAHGDDRVRAVADRVAGVSQRDGVAEAVEMILNGVW
ncbi:MAG: HAD family hydrolase [Planctomycetota bacterium]|nr:HAD family hydrolase [Planctomycetota bacterium]